MNLDSGRVKQGSMQYNEDQIFFNSNAGEPKGRDVSEGLIGSDTTGETQWAAPCIVFYR